MNDSVIFKVDGNNIGYEGYVNLWTEETKSIEHEGEFYYNTRRFEKKFYVSELVSRRPSDIELEFKEINYKVTINDTSGMSWKRLFDFAATNYGYSDNDLVRAYQVCFDNNLLDSRIKGICTYKTNNNIYKHWLDVFCNQGLLSLPLMGYGFNNGLYYQIDTETAILNWGNIPNYVLDEYKYLPKNANKDIVKMASRIMDAKIRYKKNKPVFRYI